MPFKDPEKAKEYEKIRGQTEHRKKQNKESAERRKDKIKAYSQSYNGKRAMRIGNWKRKGIISDDYKELYEYYINCMNCETCGIELIEGNMGSNKRVLDHSHITGEFRNVLCQGCNMKLPKNS